MSELFSISETYKARKLAKKRASLSVSDASPYIYKVYRLITGNIELTNKFSKKKYIIQDDILSRIYNRPGPFYHKIAKYISDEITSDDLVRALSNRKMSHKNTGFYIEMYNEIASMHIAYEEGEFFKSFIHIYRILERISYAFPMIYSRRSSSFDKTFGLLKSSFEAKDKGELGFFKKALSVIYSGDDTLDITFEIDLSEYACSGIREKYYKVYTTNQYFSSILDETTDNSKIVIKFPNVGDAIVTTRNKLVHSLSDRDKLNCSDFIDLNLFLKSTIKPYFQWIGVLFLEIMRDNYEDFDL